MLRGSTKLEMMNVLFEQWMITGGEWSKSELVIQARSSFRGRRRGSRQWFTRKQLIDKYGGCEDTADQIIASKTADPITKQACVRRHPELHWRDDMQLYLCYDESKEEDTEDFVIDQMLGLSQNNAASHGDHPKEKTKSKKDKKDKKNKKTKKRRSSSSSSSSNRRVSSSSDSSKSSDDSQDSSSSSSSKKKSKKTKKSKASKKGKSSKKDKKNDKRTKDAKEKPIPEKPAGENANAEKPEDARTAKEIKAEEKRLQKEEEKREKQRLKEEEAARKKGEKEEKAKIEKEKQKVRASGKKAGEHGHYMKLN